MSLTPRREELDIPDNRARHHLSPMPVGLSSIVCLRTAAAVAVTSPPSLCRKDTLRPAWVRSKAHRYQIALLHCDRDCDLSPLPPLFAEGQIRLSLVWLKNLKTKCRKTVIGCAWTIKGYCEALCVCTEQNVLSSSERWNSRQSDS